MRGRSLGYVLTWDLPRRVRAILASDVHADQLMRGHLLGLEEPRAHRYLARRLLWKGATPEEAASAVYHADWRHRLERAMEIACEVAAERCDAA